MSIEIRLEVDRKWRSPTDSRLLSQFQQFKNSSLQLEKEGKQTEANWVGDA